VRNWEGREFDSRLLGRGTSGSKDPRYNFQAIAQTKKARADGSHRKREEHSQDWLCHRDHHSQEWLCYRDAGMARRRVTSSVKRCGAAAPQLCSIIPPGLVCRRESLIGGRFAPRQRVQTEVCATAERLDVVWTGLLRLVRGRLWVRIPLGPTERLAA
jgi:hypothetical protein